MNDVGVSKWLRLSGVPYRYLKRTTPKLTYVAVECFVGANNRIFISQEEQKKVIDTLYEKIAYIGESALYGVGSNPTETASYQLVVDLCWRYSALCFEERSLARIKWIDLAAPDWNYLKSNEEWDIVVIHGLSDGSEPKRLEQAKDFIRKSYDCTIFILSTTSNIADFVIRKLGLQPSAVCQLSGVKINTVM